MSTTGTVGGIAALPMPDLIREVEAAMHGRRGKALLGLRDDADPPLGDPSGAGRWQRRFERPGRFRPCLTSFRRGC